ncbi:Receptor-like protein kinase THESEUS 1 [Hibiscus syriacus]|uniref:Receptor-like protein kinase THESEUS 1 n=1 Tax=Hibiscus syriacus TaxID=106335 RepID=A0A6A2YDY5_HIBSY|nr:Receptor-like protein kinase THESEUS 1 [Hibiscus syriacus]
METVYRLNMGGPLITAENDTLGRIWENDLKYLHVNSSSLDVSANPASIKYAASVRPETTPNLVYATAEAMGYANVASMNFNITWVFPVDPNFRYLVRTHFCDILTQSLNSLVFNMYINDDIAVASLDLSTLTGDLNVPYYKDFIPKFSVESDTLTFITGPNSMADITNGTINGLEIMKLINDAGSLDAALVGFCYCCMAYRRSETTQQGHSWLPLPLHGNSLTMTKKSTISQRSGTASCISLASSNLGRFFSFQEILDATKKFDESLLLRVGGFGRVYKGTLEDEIKVAVKRGNPRSEQGIAEFRTEIEMLSKLRNRHLASLIGHCDERSEMILVYEYMANGPLRSHLYRRDLPPLSWKQRLEICIGAARDFIISTPVQQKALFTKTRKQLTEKLDVYSFGVVLMEVLCTRPALNLVLPREQVSIAEWVMNWQKKGMLDQIMDSNLARKVNPASLKKYRETAEKCLAEYGIVKAINGRCFMEPRIRPSAGGVLISTNGT